MTQITANYAENHIFYRLNRWIKHLYGTWPNAVTTQIWIAICIYVLIAILQKELKLPALFYRTLQIVSLHAFDKIPLHALLTKTADNVMDTNNPNQQWLW